MTRVAVIALALVATACGDNFVSPDASTVDALPRQTLTVTQELPQEQLIEGSWTAGVGDHVGLTIDITAGFIDWDIHGHADGGTQEIASAFAQTSMTYDFSPTENAQWYLLIRNSSEVALTMTIQMQLYGGASWDGWQ